MPLSLTVLGGGPGGYTAAFAAARAGLRVTLIEKEHMGGTCLNYGCIPTKTLKASAEALDLALRLGEFGIQAKNVQANMEAVLSRKDKVCHTLRGGLEKSCTKLKITLLRGTGIVKSGSLVHVDLHDGTRRSVESDAVILATGSRIQELPGLPFDHQYICNSDDALNFSTVPRHLLILGGGVIGCEMAFIYRSFGAKVTLVEGLDRVLPLPSVDQEVSKFLQREMKKRGIVCETGRTLHQVRVADNKVQALLGPSPLLPAPSAAQNNQSPVEADALLVTVGRAPCTQALGLEEAGVRMDSKGWIEVDDYMRTSVPGIYAVGDVLGPLHIMLAHVASAEALCAVHHYLSTITDSKALAMDYSAVPSAIFTSPEVGCVGLSEEQAKAQGIPVHCPLLPFRELGKAQAMGELPGFFKLVLQAGSKRILGAHIAGAHASDLIAEVTLAISMGATAHDLQRTIHAHPTLAEGIWEAAMLKTEQS